MTGTKGASRQTAVHRYAVLDTPPDGAFDRITALAAQIFDAPISIMSIVDNDRIPCGHPMGTIWERWRNQQGTPPGQQEAEEHALSSGGSGDADYGRVFYCGVDRAGAGE